MLLYSLCGGTFYLHHRCRYMNKMSRVVRKPAFCICENKIQISFAVTSKLISAFVFAICIVRSRFCLNPKFQASSHLLWLYSPVCVGPGRKPRRSVFSQRGSYVTRANFQWCCLISHARMTGSPVVAQHVICMSSPRL